MNHCIGIRYFNKDDINAMLSLAAEIKAGNKVPNLAGARVAHVFLNHQLGHDYRLKWPLSVVRRTR